MHRYLIPLVALGVLVGGCFDDTTGPARDVYPPAAPQGLYRVNGDEQVTLYWYPNTEPDLLGYRIYEAPCASGSSCPYTQIGALDATSGSQVVSYVVHGLVNGQPRYYAVAAVDRSGNESDLSYEDVRATPRPAGAGAAIASFLVSPGTAGWDFSAYGTPYAVRSYDNPATDMFYGYYEDSLGYQYHQVFVPYGTDIQDAGYATTMDAVGYAPDGGWSASGTVEAIAGHVYIVWTADNHFAKFRVNSAGPGNVNFDWAYQTDLGNPELGAKRAHVEGAGPRPIVWLRK